MEELENFDDKPKIPKVRKIRNNLTPFEQKISDLQLQYGKALLNSEGNALRLAPQKLHLRTTLNDMYTGKTVTLHLTVINICEKCAGAGDNSAKYNSCGKCRGTGFCQAEDACEKECEMCHYTGREIKDKCQTCNGFGHVEDDYELDIIIVPGASDNATLVFEGVGDHIYGFERGDVYVKINTSQHETFTRYKKHDLRIIKEISLKEALTGVTFELEHLDGHKLTVDIHEGYIITPNKQKTIKGEGMPIPNEEGEKGDLKIMFIVEFPNKCSLLKLTDPIDKLNGTEKKEKSDEENSDSESEIEDSSLNFGDIGSKCPVQ